MNRTSRVANFYDHAIEQQKTDLAVRGCGIFLLDPPDREAKRQVDFGEIFWPISGRCIFRGKNAEEIVSPGILWYYPPGSLHDYYPVELFHYCWLAISGRHAGTFFEMLGIVPGKNPTGICPEKLFYTLGGGINFYPRREQRIAALNVAFRILTQSLIAPKSKPRNEALLIEIKKRIDMEFVDSTLSINHLAEDFGMHRGTLSRAFHRLYSECISDYILSLRFKQAIQLLQKSNAPVREIASASGFTSANYFTRLFSSRYGITPSYFRMNYRAFPNIGKEDTAAISKSGEDPASV